MSFQFHLVWLFWTLLARVGLVVTNSFSFSTPESILISPLLWKGQFFQIQDSWLAVFFFYHFEYISPLSLVSNISDEKSAVILWTIHFSFTALKILFFFCFQRFDYNGSRYGSLWVHLIGVHGAFGCLDYVFHQIWEVLSHYFSKYSFYSFLSLPSGMPTMHMLVLYDVSQVLSTLFSFSSIFFLSVP